VVNADDPHAEIFEAATTATCHTYGDAGDCQAHDIATRIGLTTWTLDSPWGEAHIEMRLLGRHNVWNALCAATICGGLGLTPDQIAAGLTALAYVPGRFQAVDLGQDFQVLVDYAHTEDGLRNVLAAARGICAGKLIVVFGCGGDRDRGKRPKMGAAAAELADYAVLTSDNPRTEDPHRILLDVEEGMQRTGRRKNRDYDVVFSREEAIRHAIAIARTDDCVLIAGKGHEDYQILGTERIHFDDREMARKALEERA
jgi:UDP-N-acetylmuramoyl-L-alanyl-D-glutamate--2,6-diaminopimelate ligase